MSSTCSVILWSHSLLFKFGFSQWHDTLHPNNSSAIQIVPNPVFHKHVKHIERGCHFIREAFDQAALIFPNVPSDL